MINGVPQISIRWRGLGPGPLALGTAVRPRRATPGGEKWQNIRGNPWKMIENNGKSWRNRGKSMENPQKIVKNRWKMIENNGKSMENVCCKMIENDCRLEISLKLSKKMPNIAQPGHYLIIIVDQKKLF